jgi:hypothetical protein
MPAERSARRRIEPWPIALVALLSAMIGTSVGFYRVAAAHPDGIGWSLDVLATPAPGGARVVAQLRNTAGAVLATESASLRRERPTEQGLDAELPLARDAATGALAADVALPRPGRWRLVVAARRDGLRVERRVDVSAP